jgi:hypothetical protein
VREAALAAAAAAGDDAVAAWRGETRTARDDIEAFARAYDDDEFPDKNAFPEGAHEEDEDETKPKPKPPRSRGARLTKRTSGTAAVRRITGGTARATRATTRTIPVMFGDASATDWRLPRRRTLCAWRRTHRRRALSANSRKQSTT